MICTLHFYRPLLPTKYKGKGSKNSSEIKPSNSVRDRRKTNGIRQLIDIDFLMYYFFKENRKFPIEIQTSEEAFF